MMQNLLNSFKDLNVLVLGDVMLDCYLYGRVNRMSPEAPVPVLEVERHEYRLGGAANVALNLKMLGAKPILCSVVGEDEHGAILKEKIMESEITDDGIIYSSHRKTTVKKRIIGNKTQLLRIDEEDSSLLADEEQKTLLQLVQNMIATEKIDALIFVDYDKGVLSQKVIDTLVTVARKQSIITTVDPKSRNFYHYKKVTLFKPNLKELQEGMSQKEKEFSMEQVRTLMELFAKEQDIDIMMTTLSENGIAVYRQEDHCFYRQETCKRPVSDVSGAGDTVIAVVTLALVAGVDLEELVTIANAAGGAVCEYAGVVPVTGEMLQKEWQRRYMKIQ
jgi:rfaE bifunctional protein kinase chain/domain